MSEQDFTRQIAHKISLKDIEAARFEAGEGLTPSALVFKNLRVSRVQVLAAVIAHEETGFLIDDGTAKISVRLFERKKDLPVVGQVISLVARIREFQGQRYLLPEGYVAVEPAWLLVRKKELEKLCFEREEKQSAPMQAPAPAPLPATSVEEEIVEESSNPLEILLQKIKSIDSGNGAAYDDLLGVCDDAMIRRLLEAGDIFEVRPGRFKVLD